MNKVRPKVLLVDDDEDIVELLQYNLEKEGYEVQGETNPLHVVDSIQTFQPNIVILDIMMPNLDGITMCQYIRSLEIGKGITVFFITSGSESLRESAIQNGGDDCIQKISGLRTLINRVNLVLKRKLVIRKREEDVQIGSWHLSKSTKSLVGSKKTIKLTELEFDLLYFLAQNADRSIPIKYLYNIIDINKPSPKFSLDKSLKTLQSKIDDTILEFTSEYRVRVNNRVAG